VSVVRPPAPICIGPHPPNAHPVTTTLESPPLAQANALPAQTRILEQIRTAAELLPAQGPISAFAFLNSLQGLEHIPFHDGVREGAKLFGCQPYLSEDAYRDKLLNRRIIREDLADAVRYELGEKVNDQVGGLASRFDLRMAMLEHPVRSGPPEEIKWFVAETDALVQMRSEIDPSVRTQMLAATKVWFMRNLALRHGDGNPCPHTDDLIGDLLARFGSTPVESWTDATWEAAILQSLWRFCFNGARQVVNGYRGNGCLSTIRLRDRLLKHASSDCDQLVSSFLIPFLASYTDQGMAAWTLPERDAGLWRSFLNLFHDNTGAPAPWLNGLGEVIQRIETEGLSPAAVIAESLAEFGISLDDQNEFLTTSMLALKGWAGLLWQMEARPDRVPRGAPPGTLVEFMAIRLLLDRIATRYVAASELDYREPLSELKVHLESLCTEPGDRRTVQRAFLVFQVAQILGWSPPTLQVLTVEQRTELVHQIEGFDELERRRQFHISYERRFRVQALDAVELHRKFPNRRVPNPKFQIVCCIDTREESFRRHLEEIEPHAETYGAAGFFSVPIYFRGVADAHYTALCPIVVRPQHWVTEEVVYSLEEENRRRARNRQLLGQATQRVHLGSRKFAGGALLTASVGYLASIPLIARVLAPGLTAKIRRGAARFVEPPPITRLRLERKSAVPGPTGDGIGFTVDEMATMGERLLRDIGLTTSFGRLVFFFGHGSSCLNNPHKSCYDCGACTGGQGGPNARALAAFLNDPRIRSILAGRGLAIPSDTYFIGGLHNTGADSITYFDIDSLPASHIPDFEAARDTLARTCVRNAHERCRRFHSARVDLTPEEAKQHVEERCEDLAQVRPEFGNASNGMCFVGRRGRIRGLYLDRRSFMHSYDPECDDDEATILGRILGAVVPVCSGINLQYYFSAVDSPGWGAGTKLPHNVVSLLGVMDGAASDMRTGLPWQGVEIHEPVRCLFVMETTEDKIRKIMARNETVRKIIENRWALLSLVHPQTGDVTVYRRGEFIPYTREAAALPEVDSSIEWYRGLRDHLPFAEVKGGLCPAD
jgi:uncharacterized protein YbcC (UPF0753/DUF2309 family)